MLIQSECSKKNAQSKLKLTIDTKVKEALYCGTYLMYVRIVGIVVVTPLIYGV